MIGELVGGIIKGLADAIVEGVSASKEKQVELLLRVESLLREGAEAVAEARRVFVTRDGDTVAAFEAARKRINDAGK